MRLSIRAGVDDEEDAARAAGVALDATCCASTLEPESRQSAAKASTHRTIARGSFLVIASLLGGPFRGAYTSVDLRIDCWNNFYNCASGPSRTCGSCGVFLDAGAAAIVSHDFEPRPIFYRRFTNIRAACDGGRAFVLEDALARRLFFRSFARRALFLAGDDQSFGPRAAAADPSSLKTHGRGRVLTVFGAVRRLQRRRMVMRPSPVLRVKVWPPPPMRQRRTRFSVSGVSATATPSLKTDSALVSTVAFEPSGTESEMAPSPVRAERLRKFPSSVMRPSPVRASASPSKSSTRMRPSPVSARRRPREPVTSIVPSPV